MRQGTVSIRGERAPPPWSFQSGLLSHVRLSLAALRAVLLLGVLLEVQWLDRVGVTGAGPGRCGIAKRPRPVFEEHLIESQHPPILDEHEREIALLGPIRALRHNVRRVRGGKLQTQI